MSVERDEVFDRAAALKPVPWSVKAPARVSVTMATKADSCPRSAALSLRYGGGAATGPLLRGSLAHAFAERLMQHLMLSGEETLFAAQPGEDAVLAAQEVAQTTKEWVDALVEELDVPLCEADVDDVREMAYHIAVGLDVPPAEVVAVERKFILETPDGILSGKVDLGSLPADGTLQVDDYKTSFYVPPEEDVQRMFQTPLYGALLLWGRPVERVPCVECKGTGIVYEQHEHGASEELGCQDCEARGTVEVVGEPLGLDHVQWVRCRQLYPRFLRDGRLASRGGDKLWSRADLRETVAAAQRSMRRIARGVQEQVWPAVSGAHCSECPCPAECPLPAQLRRFAGTIDSAAQASEAMEWAERQGDLVAATRKEVVAFVKSHDAELNGEIPVGNRKYALQVSHGKKLKTVKQRSDWEGLGAAVQDAAFNGAVFDIEDWLRPTTKTEFKVKKEEQ